MYILTLLASNKPVSEHKFENRYFVNKDYFLKFTEKHFWDVFEVILLVCVSIILVKLCLPKDSSLYLQVIQKQLFSEHLWFAEATLLL